MFVLCLGMLVNTSWKTSVWEIPKGSSPSFITWPQRLSWSDLSLNSQSLSFCSVNTDPSVLRYPPHAISEFCWETLCLPLSPPLAFNHLGDSTFFFFKDQFFLLKKDFIYLLLDRGEGREKRGRETSICGCLSSNPYWGPGPQPRQVPWLGMEPVTLWFIGQHSIRWATPIRAYFKYFSCLQI